MQSCVAGVCHIIKKNTTIKIPFPFSHVPVLNAAYLSLIKRLGYSRIVEVYHVVSLNWKSFVSSEAAVELWVTYQLSLGVAGLIVLAVDEFNEKIIPIIIPISATDDEVITD